MQTNCNYIELLSDLWALALRPELSTFYLVILYEKMVELIIFFFYRETRTFKGLEVSFFYVSNLQKVFLAFEVFKKLP